jgi:hypothetical protein
VRGDEPLHGREAEAAARRVVPGASHEGLEDPLAQLLRDAGPGVLHRDPDGRGRGRGLDPDPDLAQLAGAHVHDGVPHEVRDDAREHARAAGHPRRPRRLEVQLDAALLGRRPELVDHVVQHLAELGDVPARDVGARARELEEVVDQAAHVPYAPLGALGGEALRAAGVRRVVDLSHVIREGLVTYRCG